MPKNTWPLSHIGQKKHGSHEKDAHRLLSQEAAKEPGMFMELRQAKEFSLGILEELYGIGFE